MDTQIMKKLSKTSTLFKSSLAIIGTFLGVIAAMWAIEDRYVSAADFSQYQQRQEAFILQSQSAADKRQKNFRKQIIDDQLFELQFKVNQGTASPLDKAKIERLQRQLRELQ
jgi:hypothetical protein